MGKLGRGAGGWGGGEGGETPAAAAAGKSSIASRSAARMERTRIPAVALLTTELCPVSHPHSNPYVEAPESQCDCTWRQNL